MQFFLLQLPQCALKFSVAVALDLDPLVDFPKQTVRVMRTAIEGETVVMIYKQHAPEVRIYSHIHKGKEQCTCTWIGIRRV